MKTLLPDGTIEGAKATRHAVRARPPAIAYQRPEPPGDVTTIWRDGQVIRQSPGQRARVLADVPAILEGEP